MPTRARAELMDIPEPHCRTRIFRALALRTATHLQEWREAVVLAEGLRNEVPDDVSHWVSLAYATRRVNGIEPARSVLQAAQDKFPAVAVISFNLACYECQLGHLDAARAYLAQAFKLDPEYRAVATEDEDLIRLWPELE